MTNTLFLADMHAGHRNITKSRPQFKTPHEMFLYYEKQYLTKVTKRDIVYFLGDIIFDPMYIELIKGWPGKKILVLGNHCTEYLSIKDLAGVFDDIHGLVKYKEFWLSHAPLYPDELRGKWNIHGHLHHKKVNDYRYINVSMENIPDGPIDLVQIRKICEERKRIEAIMNAQC